MEIAEALRGIAEVREHEPMCKHTTFKIGGPADVMVMPANAEQIAQALKICRGREAHVLVMGKGSNLLVGDGGIRGVVVKLAQAFGGISIDGTRVTTEAGAGMAALARAALEAGLSGLEFAAGIPGTVGGAVCMNAGAYGMEIKDTAVKTGYLNEWGEPCEAVGAQQGFAYRRSFFSGAGNVITHCEFALKQGDKKSISALMDELNAKRRDKQPLDMPSGGSAFKRPPGDFAGRLIEQAGLRGYAIGGAQVSEKHAGFIVNRGNATADEVKRLIEYVRNTVYKNTGILLESELAFVGEN